MKTAEALDQISYLRDIASQTRLHAADGYPFFLLWGAIYFLAYLRKLETVIEMVQGKGAPAETKD